MGWCKDVPLSAFSNAYPIAELYDRAPGAEWGNWTAEVLTERYKEAVVIDPVFLWKFFSKCGFRLIWCFGLYITEAV